MSVLRNYLEQKWEEEGVIPSWETIATDLEDKVPLEVFEDIDKEVRRVMNYIIKQEGTIQYTGKPKRRDLNEFRTRIS